MVMMGGSVLFPVPRQQLAMQDVACATLCINHHTVAWQVKDAYAVNSHVALTV